jgi:uncharacterized protein YcfJ
MDTFELNMTWGTFGSIAAAIGLLVTTTNGLASDLTDEAEVVAATPIYETVNEPTRECWNEAIYAYEPVQPRS